MTQQNEAIRQAAKEVFDFIDGVTDAGKLNKRLYDAALATLRPLLDQASAGVRDDLPKGMTGNVARKQIDDLIATREAGGMPWGAELSLQTLRYIRRALTQADQPADKDDQREALAAFERVKKFADISTKGVSVFLIDEKKYLNKDLDVIHRALSGSDGRE